MQLTTEITSLTPISSCKKFITLAAYASPLLNAEHTHRVPLNLEKKECGTTMPALLLAGLKLRLMQDEDAMEQEDIHGTLDKEVHKYLRNLLTEIHYSIEDYEGDQKVSVSKTFQNKVFRHIVWGDPLIIEGDHELQFDDASNMAHNVSMSNAPSFTVPSYLCRWILEKDGLNPDTKFVHVNPLLKRIAYEVVDSLHEYKPAQWQKKASFSRRVQNVLMHNAFKSCMTADDLSRPLVNPKW